MKNILVFTFLLVLTLNVSATEEEKPQTKQDEKLQIKRGAEIQQQQHQQSGYQTGFTPLYTNTNNYSPANQLYAHAAAATPHQFYVAKSPQASYAGVQLAQVVSKVAYGGPQITYSPQPIGKLNYASQVPYPQVQLAYAHQQQQPTAHTHQQSVAYVQQPNVYAVSPSITYAQQSPVGQNQGLHTQSIPYTLAGHQHQQTSAIPLGQQYAAYQLVYPNVQTTAVTKQPAAGHFYATYHDGNIYPQQQQQQHQHQQIHHQQQQYPQQQQHQTYAYSVQPSIQIAAAKQLITPTVATAQYKSIVPTQTTHSGNGAVSYSTVTQHLGHQHAGTSLAPILHQPILAHGYNNHAAYGKAITYASPIAQASAQPSVYATHHNDGASAVQYGTHLYHPAAFSKFGYNVSPQKFNY